MLDFLSPFTFLLVAVWLAQTLLVLRDYLRRRREIKNLPPVTEEEKVALASIARLRPGKEKRGLLSHLRHPGEIAVTGATVVPALILFWPMAVLGYLLPTLEPRLSRDLLEKLRRNPDRFDDELRALHDQVRTPNEPSGTG